MIGIKQILLLFVFTVASSQRCGHSGQTTRIIGGEVSAQGRWPWLALLRMKLKTGFIIKTESDGQCTGSIIGSQWVLTAAHCVKDAVGVDLVLGEFDTKKIEGTEVYANATQIIVHEKYNPNTFANDIAVLKLNISLDFDGDHSNLEPICLTSSDAGFDAKKCVATGWGMTSRIPFSGTSPVLRELVLPVLDNRDCSSTSDFDAQVMLCAANRTGWKNVYEGDSGGPLNCQLANGVWVEKGIASFMMGGNAITSVLAQAIGYPAVYTRVSAFIPWIVGKTGISFS